MGGTFSVSDLGDQGGLIDILVVGGGAGGNAAIVSFWTGAGGGAVEWQWQPIILFQRHRKLSNYCRFCGQASDVDSGSPGANYQAQPGSPSIFTNPSSPQTITALGGGAGGTGGSSPAGGHAPTNQAGLAGGSGGGGGLPPSDHHQEEQEPTISKPRIPNLTNYGNAGAAGDSSSTVGRAGGGGGAGGAAEAIDSNPAMTTNNEEASWCCKRIQILLPKPNHLYIGGEFSPSSGNPNPTANFFVPASGLGNGGGGGTDGSSGEWRKWWADVWL